MTGQELTRLAEELGIDAIGAASAEPYVDTETHIRTRRRRGLFAEMKFTMAKPEVSCHPELLFPGARTVVSAALCYYTQSPRPVPLELREALEDRVYGCDICQDVCPWNRGVEKRRADAALPDSAEPFVSLVDWLDAEEADLRVRYDRLYFPRNDVRYLRRNALIAAGNVGTERERPAVERYAESEDELLREQARWARARMAAR
jgi:epoxyqueuosine reductase QueG